MGKLLQLNNKKVEKVNKIQKIKETLIKINELLQELNYYAKQRTEQCGEYGRSQNTTTISDSQKEKSEE